MEDNNSKARRQKSLILKFSLFATGLSGIVAEYILSTLATYFLGDSIIQWTLVLSFMLFSMGLGSRLSRFFEGNLLEKFILIEFILSILVSFAAIIVYIASGFTDYNGMIIYMLSIAIGLLIGLEIPLVTRLNEEYESLRLNIASVMENDYYGSLLGGIFFAFVGLPFLGLTYTPFILGTINFSVALLLFWRFKALVRPRRRLTLDLLSGFVFLLVGAGFVYAEPIIFFGEQQRYSDKVIYQEQSKYQKLVITQWKNDYWLYINGNQQFSTRDEELYHEPLVHPVMKLVAQPRNILVMGGGDGIAVREILKYPSVENITLVDLDPAMTRLAKNHPVLLEANDSSFFHPKVSIINQDAYKFMNDTREYFDAVIIDLPDPRTVELGRLYSKEFYLMCYKHLRPQGIITTQSGSPYYNGRAFACIDTTMQSAGFETYQIHNQVLTLGEWGWTIGSKHLTRSQLRKALRTLQFKDVPTRWINHEAMTLMTSYGKADYFYNRKYEKLEVNTIHNPVLYRYYLQGNWDLY